MLAQPLARVLFAVLALAAVIGHPIAASAQTTESIVVRPESLDRNTEFRPETQGPNWISHADCVADDHLFLTLAFSNVTTGGIILEAWVGVGSDDCTGLDKRDGPSSTCWQVFQGTPDGQTTVVDMRAQDIVARNRLRDPGESGPNSGTLADCEEGSWPTDQTDITIWFMFVDAGGNIASGWGTASWQTKVDIHGPLPPTGVTAGVGEDSVVLDWDEGAVGTDVAGYNFYCAPSGSVAPGTTLDGGTQAAAEAGVSDASAGSTATDGGADATATDGAGGSGGTSGTGDSGINPNCPTTLLVPGELPDESLACGKITGQFVSGGTATGLTNGTSYAIAVAGRDTVGNVGPLSETICGQPQPVEDFFERYRAAGGKGGGGFCSFGAHPARGAALLVLGAGLALAFRRRRWPSAVR
jgi:hypothetical protein